MNETINIAHPPIASKEAWLAERLKLLSEEKTLTRAYDKVNAQRRRLPMVKVDKEYRFEGPTGERSLLELFDGRIQLIVHHFMFDPLWEKGCGSCTWHANALGDLSSLAKRDTTMVRVSRAPLQKLQAYKEAMGWTMDWYSSGNSDFNYDFGVTLDRTRGLVTYNYRSTDEVELDGVGKVETSTELPGMSVFFRVGEDVFHTYSAYGRGLERLMDALGILDITPYGRQEDFEDSPPGWPQEPTYG